MDKADALANIALEALNTLGQKSLLLLGDAFQGVDGLLGTVGLFDVSRNFHMSRKEEHTPSSTGTEKKSLPVCLAIASPPGTPGR